MAISDNRIIHNPTVSINSTKDYHMIQVNVLKIFVKSQIFGRESLSLYFR